MKNLFRNPERSITAKLIITTGLLIVILSSIFWYSILQKQQKDVMAIAVEYGNSFTGFIKDSTRHSMLNLHRDAIQQILEDIQGADGVERVRIFDHDGSISYSTYSHDVGNSVESSSIACRGCHVDAASPSGLLKEPKLWEVYKDPLGSTGLKIVDTINNEPSCYTASCHMHSREQKILGFIEADISMAMLDEALFKQALALTAYILIFVIAVSLSLGIINYKIVTRPVKKLAEGMQKVAGGDLDHPVQINSIDEIGVLADTFNSMIMDLKEARHQREIWTQTLEDEIAKKTDEMKKTHAGLVQTEKLASLGRMAAGMAHEINNPLTGVITYAHLLKKRFPEEGTEADDINVIIEEAERCSKIIKNLQTFARAKVSDKNEINVNNALRQILMMVSNQSKFLNIKFHTDFSKETLVTTGDPNQLHQICLNMLINASDAMNKSGEIAIATRSVSDNDKIFIEIEFKDTGTGIRDEDMPKLFEPFFTTKPPDKGTGLGLSVSHGIVKHLGGSIRVISALGRGTSFFVRLPSAGDIQ